MIDRITGTLEEIGAESIVLDAGGIGYEIRTPRSVFSRLPEKGHRLTIYTHLHVREDGLSLYGFATKEDRALFRLIVGVSGAGPKIGLEVLSSMPAAKFKSAVLSGDVSALTRIPGIGKKTAERLILELKGRLAKDDVFGPAAAGAALELEPAENDAIRALVGLGYSESEAAAVVWNIGGELPETSASDVRVLIKEALKRLGQRLNRPEGSGQ